VIPVNPCVAVLFPSRLQHSLQPLRVTLIRCLINRMTFNANMIDACIHEGDNSLISQ